MITYWTMKNGEKIDIDKMDINHLRNCLKMVVRAIEHQKAVERRKKRELHLNGEIAQQMYDQMLIEELGAEDEYDFLT